MKTQRHQGSSWKKFVVAKGKAHKETVEEKNDKFQHFDYAKK